MRPVHVKVARRVMAGDGGRRGGQTNRKKHKDRSTNSTKCNGRVNTGGGDNTVH